MKLNPFTSALVAVLLVVPAVFAAEDITGKWGGSFIITMDQNEPKDDVAHMVVKQTGAELTGTIGPSPEEQWPIAKGKIATTKVDGKDVTKIVFEVTAEGEGGPVLQFELELVGGHLKGKAKAAQDGRTMSAVVDLARVK